MEAFLLAAIPGVFAVIVAFISRSVRRDKNRQQAEEAGAATERGKAVVSAMEIVEQVVNAQRTELAEQARSRSECERDLARALQRLDDGGAK